MNRYLQRRLMLVIPTLIGVTLAVFVSVRLLPGGPASTVCGMDCTEQQVEDIERAFGLDRPIMVQYFDWLGRALRGDFGTSLFTGLPIAEQIRQKAPVTFELGFIGMVTAIIIGIPVGVMSALKQDSTVDYVARSLSIGLLAIPSFWLAIVLISLGATYSFWTPPLNYAPLTEDPIANIKIMWVPGLLLGFSLSGTLMRLTRTQMLDVLRQDYIRTAAAKGLRGRVVVLRHALRNALIPIVTVLGSQSPYLVGGSVILETVFSLPGMGRYFLEALNRSDLSTIQAVNLVIALVVVMANLFVDILYTRIDPRIRY